MPESAPPAKIAQLLVFGCTVMLVHGTYDDAFELCLQAAEEFGWYNRNTGYNPYMTEGKKTARFEICEQLAWERPIASSCQRGRRLHHRRRAQGAEGPAGPGLDRPHAASSWACRRPGSASLYDAWRTGTDVLRKTPIDAQTVADSISAGLPRDRIKAMAAVRRDRRRLRHVSDDEILAAIPALARGCGVFAEPAGAAAYAGLVKAVDDGLVSPTSGSSS